MYHSITFGTKNTWDDWHLIPTSRPLFNPPSVKTNMVEIPGGDGMLDLTTSLAGRPLYKNRTGSVEFYVDNDFRDWSVLYSEIMLYLHGQKMRAVLEDDPSYYYEGRFSVNAWKSNPDRSQITINYDVFPYKQYINNSTDEWLWDTFNFETGIIRVRELSGKVAGLVRDHRKCRNARRIMQKTLINNKKSFISEGFLELMMRFELMTSSLPRMCSTN